MKLDYIQTVFLWTAISFILGTLIFMIAQEINPDIDWGKWISVYLFCGLGFGAGRAVRKYKKNKRNV